MDLFYVPGMRLLLGACAETLETLRLYPQDPRGERLSLKGVRIEANDFAVESSPQDFNLSRNKSLRTFEVTARYTSLATASSLNYALSTITSPVFSKVIVFYRDYDFMGVSHCSGDPLPTFHWVSPYQKKKALSRQRMRLQVFRGMHKVRDFELVLCADVWHHLGKHTMGELNRAVAVEKAENGFSDFSSEPLVTYSPRRSSYSSGEEHSRNIAPSGCVSARAPL